jgi:hypothetical protein
MKGIVFTEFLEMIENSYGYDMVDTVISKANLPHNGIYVAVGTYPHTEIINLVTALSQETNTPVKNLLEGYGKHLFALLIKTHPQLAADKPNPLDFIESVDSFIHVEVRKLYPDAELPKLTVFSRQENILEMDYFSTRHMHDFGVGLIQGCAEFYKTNLDVFLQPLPQKDSIRFRIVMR